MASSLLMVGRSVHHVPTFSPSPARMLLQPPNLLQISRATKPLCLKKRMILMCEASEKTPPPLMEEEEEEEETEKKNGGVLENFKLKVERLTEMEKFQFAAKLVLYVVLVSGGGGGWQIKGGDGGWAIKSLRIGKSQVEINFVLLLLLPIIRMIGLKTTLKTSIPTGSIDLDIFTKEEKKTPEKKKKKKKEEDETNVLDDAQLYVRFLNLMFKAESAEVAKQAMDSAWSAFIREKKKRVGSKKED